MSDESPLPVRILDAAENLLRRYGAEKTNVVDIAKSLEMSHGNIYRHFPSKKAILDAVAARWLHAVSSPLALIANDREKPADARLANWFHTLRMAKQRKVLDDPELFQVYHKIVGSMRDVVALHIAELTGQIERIIADGLKAGIFRGNLDPAKGARAFLQGSIAFHHPALLVKETPTDQEAEMVLDILLTGMRAKP